MKVFASGSCRLLTTISDGREKITPIHSLISNFTGPNFLGKLHNIKQHIQFIKFIKGEIKLPDNILPNFLTSFNTKLKDIDNITLIPFKISQINEQFNECDFYIFEICSLKIYTKDNYQVHSEHTTDFQVNLQTEQELYDDLLILYNMIPKDKKIIFQTHFRPNIIYNNISKMIIQRTIIYDTVFNFCKRNNNTYIHDPSILLKSNKALYNSDVHFNEKGYIANFNDIYTKYFRKHT